MASNFNKLQVVELTNQFEKATKIVQTPKREPEANEALLKVHYVGVNAIDVKVTAGEFFMYADKDVPFDFGFEALVEIEQVGDGMAPILKSIGLKEGSPALYVGDKAYAEYIYVDDRNVKHQLFQVPALKPEYLAFGVSGLTASIALETAANIKEGDKIVVTAAAGGLGHLTVQWALSQGAHVIGMASNADKMILLKNLGCHRIINYEQENVDKVLTHEYPQGVDIVWETVGGEMHTILLKHLAYNGMMLKLGEMSSYLFARRSDVPSKDYDIMVNEKGLKMRSFAIFSHSALYRQYVEEQIDRYEAGKYKPTLDFGKKAPDGPFKGLQAVAKGVNWLHSGKNVGKVMVQVV